MRLRSWALLLAVATLCGQASARPMRDPRILKVKERADTYIENRALRADPRFGVYCSSITLLNKILNNKDPKLVGERRKRLPEAKRAMEEMFRDYAKQLGGESGWPTVHAAVVSAFNADPSIGLVLLEELFDQSRSIKEGDTEKQLVRYLNDLGLEYQGDPVALVDALLEMDKRKVSKPKFSRKLPMTD